MKTSDFNFDLPEELIAQTPLKDRSSSKLLVVDKKSGEVSHKTFKDIKSYLKKGDCLVLNNTKVLPARLFGNKEGTDAKVEFLLLNRKDLNTWEILVKPGKKAKVGSVILFGEGLLRAEVIDIVEGGNRIVEFSFEGTFENILEKLGEMPLPPYITEKLEEKTRYQTVYAKEEGSAAAPTAGLHFTPELLKEIEELGVFIAFVTLHVGLGTFRPVKVLDVKNHEMHKEYYNIDQKNADIINKAKKNGGNVIAVGTTSVRTLESVANCDGEIIPKSGYTDIFIYPPYKFKIVDNIITNFHLPESTLIMLVSAFSSKENILNAYEIAVLNKYRFFSFGDCMFVK